VHRFYEICKASQGESDMRWRAKLSTLRVEQEEKQYPQKQQVEQLQQQNEYDELSDVIEVDGQTYWA
jgi:hypothetical protein